MALKFEYCECGCKGYSGGSKGMYYWIYWDLEESYSLFEGHGYIGRPMGVFHTYEAAIAAANKDFTNTD